MTKNINISFSWWNVNSPTSPIPKNHQEVLESNSYKTIFQQIDRGQTSDSFGTKCLTDAHGKTQWYIGRWEMKIS